MRLFTAALSFVIVACAGQAPEPVPIPEPSALALRFRSVGNPDAAKLIEFEWRYRGHEGHISGDGALRFNPPDSVRLDLLGPGWTGVQSAVMLGEETYYVGEQRIDLPPPMFIWALFGVFRPPHDIAPEGTKRGERTELAYQLATYERIVFEFDGGGNLIGAERRYRGRTVQVIELRLGRIDEGSGWRWPKEARFRDLGEFNEVRVEVKEIRDHAPFEPRIFTVVDH